MSIAFQQDSKKVTQLFRLCRPAELSMPDEVSEGKDIVDKISASNTTRSGMFADVPVENIIIEKAEIV